MAKTVVNLTDTLGTVVTKVNKISNDLGDIEGHFLYDSSMTGAITKLQHGRDLDSAGIRGLISVTNSGGSGSISYNSSTGVLTYAGVGAFNTVEDATPQLGGDLDVNGKNINFGDAASIGSDDTLQFGASQDLQIYHHASAGSFIDDKGTGPLYIRSDLVNINKYTGEKMAHFGADSAVELYYNNLKKIETTAAGVEVTGTITSTGVVTGSGFTIGSAVINEAELELLDGASTAVTGDKVVVADGNKDITGARNITATGAITAGSLVIGNANISEAELEIIDGATVSTDELNLLDLASGEQVGVFKVEAISAGNPVSGDFTNNTKIIFQY